MNWTVFWQYLIGLATTGGFLLGAVTWLAKRSIDAALAHGLETHKAELRVAGDKEVERTKSALAITANEQSIIFSRLHEKRAAIIAELYSFIAVAVSETSILINPTTLAGEPSKRDRAKSAFAAINEASAYFAKNKIWFTPDTCTLAESLIRSLYKLGNEFYMYWEAAEQNPENEEAQKAKMTTWFETWDKMDKDEVPPAMEALEDDFRELIGVVDKEGDDDEEPVVAS